MISDILSDAVAAIDHYLQPDFDTYYPDKEEILQVRNAMERLRAKLDGPFSSAPVLAPEAPVRAPKPDPVSSPSPAPKKVKKVKPAPKKNPLHARYCLIGWKRRRVIEAQEAS